jgi:SH3 domain protein
VRRMVAFLILGLAATTAAGQSVRYIQDFIKVPLRTGTSTQNKILRMLPSGARVELLEESGDGYARVRSEEGTEGWILSRYLMEEPSARDRLALAQKSLAAQQDENQSLKREISTLKAHAAEMDRSNKELETTNADLSQELESVRHTAGRSLAIGKENENFRQELARKNDELEALVRENAQLNDRSQRDWFLAGAGVALGGLVLGLIIPRIPWRRRKRWDQF